MTMFKLSVLAMALMTTATHAEATPPAALNALKDISAKGTVLGFEAWGSPTQDFLWLHDPATGSVIAGYPFDPTGKSLNPAHEGENALTLSGFIEANVSTYVPPVSVGEDGKVSVSIPESNIPEVEALMAGMDKNARDAAISGLIESLRPVKSEAEFNAAVASWIEGLRGAKPAAPAAAEAAPAEPVADPAVQSAEPEKTGDATDTQAENPGKTLLEAMQEGFTLELGQADAPLAHALIDPSHAPSLAAIKELKPAIEAGKIRLAVLLVPAASEDAAGITAGLLMSEDPVAALFALADAVEDPAKETPFRRFSDLEDDQEEGVRRNYALAVAYELPALPFFGFHAADGERYIKGIPSIEQFDGIGASPAKVEGEAAPAEQDPQDAVPEAPAD